MTSSIPKDCKIDRVSFRNRYESANVVIGINVAVKPAAVPRIFLHPKNQKAKNSAELIPTINKSKICAIEITE